MTGSYTPATMRELRVWYGMIQQFIRDEKRMRERVLKPGRDKDAKLRRCDEAMAALVALKDFAKQHAEESPEQVTLFDEPVRRQGGY